MADRILIIKPSALGDVATTLPLLCDLKAAFPAAQIDWLIHPAYAAVIEGHDALHQIIPFDRKKLAAWWYKPAAFRLFNALLTTLSKNKYDIVIDAQGLFRSGFLAALPCAKIRIGFAHAREAATLFYTHKVALPDAGTHMLAVDRMRALAGPLNIKPLPTAEFRLPIQKHATTQARQLLQSAAFPTENFIALIPGARWNTKRWPLDRYAALAQHLLTENHPVLLLGSPDEKSLCDQIETTLKTKNSEPRTQNPEPRTQTSELLANLAGQTDLPTMIALLARARLVIGNDSGPLHLAVALHRPILALYGPTAPTFVGPYAQLDHVLRHDIPCHPCRRRTCDHHSCMNGLAVELVWEKTKATIQTLDPSK